jgi:hypothetical protein
MLREVAFDPEQRPLCMVCGPTSLVESVASTLAKLGNPPDRIKTADASIVNIGLLPHLL